MKGYWFIFLITACGCAAHKNNPFSNTYHNMTAHYNSYFIAEQRLAEIESDIVSSQDWDFDKTLPAMMEFDSILSASLSEKTEDCIQKASLSIHRHPGSNWEFKSYLLLAWARFYTREFPEAIETFKFVNVNTDDEDLQHQALIGLIRTFVEYKEIKNALSVVGHLSNKKMSKENEKNYHLVIAYLYQKRNDLQRVAEELSKAALLSEYPEAARINFTAGQAQQAINSDKEAYSLYKNVLKSRPAYNFEFYAKLYMSQVSLLADEDDLNKIEKYFNHLIKDPKNEEYKGKIYYELADFKRQNGKLAEAIDSYKLSARNAQSLPRQRALAYWELGKIYFDTLKNFQMAQRFYDSATISLPQEDTLYPSIFKRSEILKEFVKEANIITKNDSLLSLSLLPEDSLKQLFRTQALKKISKEKEKQRAERKEARVQNNNINLADSGVDLIGLNKSNNSSSWYFENSTIVARGKNEFIKIWGDRQLEDNWRIEKDIEATEATTENSEANPSESETPTVSEASGETKENNIEAIIDSKMALVPKTRAQKDKLLKEIEDATYNLGQIYYLKLEERQRATETFEQLLSKFPTTEYAPEVLYQLYLTYKNTSPTLSLAKKKELKQKYPESIYAKLSDNPHYKEDQYALENELKEIYSVLYSQYETGNYESALQSVDSLAKKYPKNDFIDNIKLLGILCLGKIEGNYKFQFELDKFIAENQESDIVDYAKTLLQASQELQKERYNSSKTKYKNNLTQPHYFIIVYSTDANKKEEISKEINKVTQAPQFKTLGLRSADIILNNEKSSTLVSSFDTKEGALIFLEYYKKVNTPSSEVKLFAITKQNYDIMHTLKEDKSYETFYQQYYELDDEKN